MKKFLLLLNNYLANFWFILLLLTIAGYLVIIFDPTTVIAFSLGKNGEFYLISSIIWSFWVSFLLPLALISSILATIIWLKDKTGNSYHGFSALLITILSLGLLFLFVPRLLTLDYEIKNSTGVFKPLIIENHNVLTEAQRTDLNIIFRYGVSAKNELDTAKQTYTKDMIMDTPITTELKISDSELIGIHEMLKNLKVFEDASKNTTENISIIPCSNYYLKAKINSSWQELEWNDCHGKISDKFQTVTNFITQIIKSKEEYKILPDVNGGYL